MDSIGFRGQCLSVLQNGKAEKMSRKDQKIYCNCCGKRILSRMEQDVVTVEQRWGYFSEKDGEIHRFCICESCYDRIRAGFQIPVEIVTAQEYL